ncbi:Uncharacterized protein SCF082_LOCUS41659 [Durusdinium trenchii]|uniref:Tyr recombinase domain-containing protein n=1 Tax=Durusdinium trenchii TaxID=1381693 RepID=A0ABP0QIZ7_9DINO
MGAWKGAHQLEDQTRILSLGQLGLPEANGAPVATASDSVAVRSGWIVVEEAEGPSTATTPGSAEQLLETERLIRRRPRGSLQPDSSNTEERQRPSLKRALEIASDPTLSQRARLGFDQLVYSAGSNDTKASMFRTWQEVQERSGLPALPLTQSKCETFVAVLRAAGYRSSFSYLLEARQQHLRAGYPWSHQLDIVMKDCKRVATRGLGPAKRSEEVRIEWWQKLFELEGLKMAEKPLAPFGGILLWALGSHFLLREGELAMLDLHENTIRLDEVAKTITLSLSVSKSDPGGRTARRTLRCCGAEDDTTFHGLLCPFEVGFELVERQKARTKADRSATSAFSIPLVGQRGNPFAFTCKTEVVLAAQQDAERLTRSVEEASSVEPAKITGHFMRRSGVKRLARANTPKEVIMKMARHSSNAIEAYIEDAMEESPDMATILTDHEQVQAALNAFWKDLDELKDQVKVTAEAAAERPSSSKAALESLDTEVRRMWDNIRPAYIRNTTTNKVHSTQACLFWEVPSAWATKCGWKWAASSKTVTYVSEDELNQFPLCDKCFA